MIRDKWRLLLVPELLSVCLVLVEFHLVNVRGSELLQGTVTEVRDGFRCHRTTSHLTPQVSWSTPHSTAFSKVGWFSISLGTCYDVIFMELLVPLLGTSGDVCSGFQNQGALPTLLIERDSVLRLPVVYKNPVNLLVATIAALPIFIHLYDVM